MRSEPIIWNITQNNQNILIEVVSMEAICAFGYQFVEAIL